MQREIMITAGAAAILAAGLAGCSGNKSVSTPNGGVAAASAANTKVLIDGRDQNVKGQVVCASNAGSMNIAIGGPSANGAGGGTGIGAVLTDASPPLVTSVALGNVNGVALGVAGTTGTAKATKDGNSYKITGTASGADLSNPMGGPVTKPFEIDVTCP